MGHTRCTLSRSLVLSAAVLLGVPAGAVELTSSSFRMRGASPSAGAHPELLAPGGSLRFHGSGVSVGLASPVGYTGSPSTHSTLSGFWGIAAAGIPHLDTDGDGIASFDDDDDDGDGLSDAVETATGSFLGPGDTGTSAVNADSDGDGIDDGTEVAGGTDPNDPNDPPALPELPALGAIGRALLVLGLAIPTLGLGRVRNRRPR